jgi:predicted tellurium resistance membrane protein TerC
MNALFTSSGLVALITLTFLEIVLGVDNVIFISILSSKLPRAQQGPARRIGLLTAMGMRVLLLFSLVWIVRLTAPLFYIFGAPSLWTRSYLDRRWPVPAREDDHRNSRAVGG